LLPWQENALYEKYVKLAEFINVHLHFLNDKMSLTIVNGSDHATSYALDNVVVAATTKNPFHCRYTVQIKEYQYFLERKATCRKDT
jgi:tRNA U38,U39,U40 pseudouridine synthase TruA